MKFKTLTAIAAVLGGSLVLSACFGPAVSNPYGDNEGDVWSGYETARKGVRSMQDDDFENPGMPVVDAAAEMWDTPDGESGASCASCHGAPDDASGGTPAADETPDGTEGAESEADADAGEAEAAQARVNKFYKKVKSSQGTKKQRKPKEKATAPPAESVADRLLREASEEQGSVPQGDVAT